MSRSVSATALWLGAAYPVALLLLSVQQVLAPQRNGLLAIGQILAPHLFLAALLLAPLALARSDAAARRGGPRRPLRMALAAVLVVGLVRFLPGTISLPPQETPGAVRVSVSSWNRQALGGPSAQEVVALLRASTSSVFALQELRPEDATLIAADEVLVARFPHRVLRPHQGTYGMGLLSAHPILEEGWRNVPHTVWARLDLGAGRDVLVVNAHPLPASITTLDSLPLPVGYDASGRDAAIDRLRGELVDRRLANGDTVLLAGDFNVTVREPAFTDLAAGLVDVQAAVGLGPGSTWRPDRLEGLPFGLLRIDHLLAGPGITPLHLSIDCTPRGSDHCIVHAVLEMGL